MTFRTRATVIFAILLSLSLSGCLFHSHNVKRTASTQPLESASQQELIDIVDRDARQVTTLSLTVDIATSYGGSKRGKITDYKEIRGYILLRKPSMLRVIGLLPIVRNKGFDLVSDGDKFQLWVPPTNKFYVGQRDIVVPSSNPLYNLRPQMFYDALILREIDPVNEIAVLEDGTEVVYDPRTKQPLEQPDYTILVLHHGPQGWNLSRKIVFSRADLRPHEQLIYTIEGTLATDAHYEEYRDYDGVSLPSVINIWRPQEEYTVTLKMVKVRANETLTDEQFALQMPAGAQVVHLDQSRTASALLNK